MQLRVRPRRLMRGMLHCSALHCTFASVTLGSFDRFKRIITESLSRSATSTHTSSGRSRCALPRGTMIMRFNVQQEPVAPPRIEC